MFWHNQYHSPTGPPPHRTDVAPRHLAEAEEEPLPDHPRQLVLGDRYKTECLVEADELQGRVHVQHFMAAGIDQCLHHDPGKATPAEFFKGEDASDFVPVLVQSAPRNRSERPVDKGAENTVLGGVGLLLVIVLTDFFDKGESIMGEFTGEGVGSPSRPDHLIHRPC